MVFSFGLSIYLLCFSHIVLIGYASVSSTLDMDATCDPGTKKGRDGLGEFGRR